MYIVYVLENQTRGVFYVGYTSRPLRERLWKHATRANASDRNKHKKSIIKSEGASIRQIAIVSTQENARLLEQIAIARLRTQGVRLANLDAGGSGAARWTDEMRVRHRETMRRVCNRVPSAGVRPRPVIRVSPDGSEERFESVSSGARASGLKRGSAVNNAISGRCETAGGYAWRYAEE
jgi:predicted GIY-YIG superfamily endonuclease